MNKLHTLYHVAARRAQADGCRIEGTSTADFEHWVRQNFECRPEIEPHIVLGIASAMAGIVVRELGHEDKIERVLNGQRPMRV